MTPRRIAFVLAGGGLSGGNRVIVTHANRLMERGHVVRIVVLRWPVIWRPKALFWRLHRKIGYATRLRHDHLHEFRGPVTWERVSRLERAIPDGDAVIATHWLTADPVAALPSRKGAKYYFIQGYEGDIFDPARVDATWRLPMRKIVVSSWLQRLARERAGDESAILVVNGVDTGLFHAPPRELNPNPTAGTIYSDGPWKGTGVAFEALRRARERAANLRMICFGDTRPTRALPLPPDTQFVHRPSQQSIRELYAACDVWLCASTTEGFGLPPLEAMACRCPVVCTRCGGPEGFVRDGENGYLVPVGDAGAMADRIVRILADAQRWQCMSDAAYETRLRFTWEDAGRRMEAALIDWPGASVEVDKAAGRPGPVGATCG